MSANNEIKIRGHRDFVIGSGYTSRLSPKNSHIKPVQIGNNKIFSQM